MTGLIALLVPPQNGLRREGIDVEYEYIEDTIQRLMDST
jgi:hypothetical protein